MLFKSKPKLNDEQGRMAALNRYQVLDSPAERPFENIVSMVEDLLKVPICAVSLVDVDRQWFKAQRGLQVNETPRSVAFCDKAIGMRDPLIVPNALEDVRFKDNPLVTGAPHIRAYAGAPLRTPDGYQLGTLCAIDVTPRDFEPSEIKVLESFAKLVVDELELRIQASSDVLTGAMTRACWFNAATDMIEQTARHSRFMAVAMLDIDHFKRVNDSYGHPFGDKVIQAVIQACASQMRPGSRLGRLGGEEFAILMPDCTLDEAVLAMDRCRTAIARIKIPAPNGDVVSPTASFGIAPLYAYTATPQDLIEMADAALYQAKASGRNCIEVGHVLGEGGISAVGPS